MAFWISSKKRPLKILAVFFFLEVCGELRKFAESIINFQSFPRGVLKHPIGVDPEIMKAVDRALLREVFNRDRDGLIGALELGRGDFLIPFFVRG